MFTVIAKAIGSAFVDKALGGIFDAVERYQNNQITRAELDAAIRQALLAAWKDVEVAWADSTAKMYASLMDATKQSKIVAWGWGVTLFSQVGVLVWHQVGIPAYTHWFLEPGQSYPSSGTTVEWAYLLIALLLGGGALMLKGKAPRV